ncbi:hypothetical protein Goari_002267 [Gossypium aridum]|uniref:Uncharacterized protein n=1 Tax=Gossypium aridum TaxID=34290 RepID=A0A7J8Y7Y7_GOSAI|nr:hypothetical protein [Gossypium aridum]
MEGAMLGRWWTLTTKFLEPEDSGSWMAPHLVNPLELTLKALS